MSSVPDLDPKPDPPDPHVLGLPDPDSSVRGADPSIIKQNSKKNLDSYYFATSFELFVFEK
jgi:hypothetical protein